MNTDAFDERDFVEGLRENNPQSFKVLYEKYAPKLHAFSSRFNFTRQEAVEIVQETFIRIWQSRQSIYPDKYFNTFLITIAKHLIYNQIRRNTYRARYVNEQKSGIEKIASDAANERELQKLIHKGMGNLPDRCRKIFSKSRIEGLSNGEIADEMNISKSTVENQLNKALKKMRLYLQHNGFKSLSIITMFAGTLNKFFS
jgi:RNA polymerase sigma-70 factor (ECF subfamily)